MATAVMEINSDAKHGELAFEIVRGRITKIFYIEVSDNYRTLKYSPEGELLSIATTYSSWTSTSMGEEMLNDWNVFARTELALFKKEHLKDG